MESANYQILIVGQYAGFTSIHKGSLVTQFSLFPQYRRYGQDVFTQIKKLENVQAAFVPTCDEFFLSQVLDAYRELARQAYFFTTPAAYKPVPTKYELKLAEESDIELIKEGSGDFFGDIQEHLDNHELFLTLLEGDCVGFGIIDKSMLIDTVASVGMFVIEHFRQRGAGTAIINLLMNKCINQGLQPVAGCWYYNHLSKKTLERAGMFTQTRLLKVDF